MALNYPGPYQIKLFYTTNTFQHVLNLNLGIVGTPAGGTPFSSINVVSQDSSNPPLNVVVDNLVAVVRPHLYSVDATVDQAELWRIAPNTFDGTFISAYAIGLAGTSAALGVAASEQIYTFRTAEGGIMKVYLEETSEPPGVTQTYAGLGTAKQNLVDHILNGVHPWLGRDTSFPISFLRFHPGQNERVFKERFR